MFEIARRDVTELGSDTNAFRALVNWFPQRAPHIPPPPFAASAVGIHAVMWQNGVHAGCRQSTAAGRLDPSLPQAGRL